MENVQSPLSGLNTKNFQKVLHWKPEGKSLRAFFISKIKASGAIWTVCRGSPSLVMVFPERREKPPKIGYDVRHL